MIFFNLSFLMFTRSKIKKYNPNKIYIRISNLPIVNKQNSNKLISIIYNIYSKFKYTNYPLIIHMPFNHINETKGFILIGLPNTVEAISAIHLTNNNLITIDNQNYTIKVRPVSKIIKYTIF
jgi:hypothetical protein